MEEKVAAHHSGKSAGVVSIREGIYESSVMRDVEMAGRLKVPPNFTPLKDIQTQKTSIRKPSDYPVLCDRFAKKETER